MDQHPIPYSAPSSGDPVPQILRGWLEFLQPCFTVPTWEHMLVIVMGAVLAPGKHTISACLRMTGRADAGNFASYHQLLNRARWRSGFMTRRLLGLIIGRLVPDGPVVIGVDDTIERRWGRKITARGIYRDPVRSSHGHFVKASGLRWLSFMVLTPVPWAACVKALPVLTLLAPSERADQQCGRRHKLLTDWAKLAKVSLAKPMECQRRVARACSNCAAGCQGVRSFSWAIAASPSTSWPMPLAAGPRSSAVCAWMPTSSRRLHPGRPTASDALRKRALRCRS